MRDMTSSTSRLRTKKTLKQNFAEQNLAVMESFRQNEDDMEGQSSRFLSRVSTVVQNNKLDQGVQAFFMP